MKKLKWNVIITLLAIIWVSSLMVHASTEVIFTSGAQDGWAMNDGECVTNTTTAWVGYRNGGWSDVLQAYFTIPDSLKEPGIQINSATLYMETHGWSMVGNTGYSGIYFQFMQYTYDCNEVTVAQALAIDGGSGIPNEANFTRIGPVQFQPVGQWMGYSIDVTAELQADIAAGWGHMPIAVKSTLSDGSFYPSPSSYGEYFAYMWMSEANPGSRINPTITVDYSVIPEPVTMLLLGLGAMVSRFVKH